MLNINNNLADSLKRFLRIYRSKRQADAGITSFADPMDGNKKIQPIPHDKIAICLLPFIKRCLQLDIEYCFFLDRSAAILEIPFNLLQEELYKKKIIERKIKTSHIKFSTTFLTWKKKDIGKQFLMFLTKYEAESKLSKDKINELLCLYYKLDATEKKRLDAYLKNKSTNFNSLIKNDIKHLMLTLNNFSMVQLPDLDLHWDEKEWCTNSIKQVLEFMMNDNNHYLRPIYNIILKDTQFANILKKPVYIIDQGVASAYTAYHGDIIFKAFNPRVRYYLGAFYMGLNDANERRGPFLDIGLLVCPKDKNFPEGTYVYDDAKSLIPHMGVYIYERRTDLSGVNYIETDGSIVRLAHEDVFNILESEVNKDLLEKEEQAVAFFNFVNKMISETKLIGLARKLAGEGLKEYIDSSDIMRMIISRLDKSNAVFAEDFEVYAPKPQFVGKVGKPYYRVFKGDWPEFSEKVERIMETSKFKKWEEIFQSCKDYIELAVVYDWIIRRNQAIKKIKGGIKKLKETDFKSIKNYLQSEELRFSSELLNLLQGIP